MQTFTEVKCATEDLGKKTKGRMHQNFTKTISFIFSLKRVCGVQNIKIKLKIGK